jgi:hypothetical protein
MKKLELHLKDASRLSGSIIYFGLLHTEISNKISNIIPIDKNYHTWYKSHNTKELSENLPENELYCFAVIDFLDYSTTKQVLEYIWGKMSRGGTIFITNYDENSVIDHNLAVNEFIASNNIANMSKQMMVNGIKESFLVIKASTPETKIDLIKTEGKITIAMVLKTGGPVYNHQYVNALARSIKNHVTVDYELVCLADDSTGILPELVDRIIPLTNGFPTWWNKIELFKPHQFTTDRIFYIDLDTIIIDNIDNIVTFSGIFAGLCDFYGMHSLGSGLMAWNKLYTENIYMDFVVKSKDIIQNYKEGDQQWINESKPSITYFQDMHPNQIVSFKRHCMNSNRTISIPKEAKIICFHGNPRPHTVTDPIISQHWIP